MDKRLEATVSGRVQLVMFRDFVRRRARSLGIVGIVKNQKDGTVFVTAEGSEEKLRTLLEYLHRGSILAEVTSVSPVWKEPMGEYTDFSISYE